MPIKRCIKFHGSCYPKHCNVSRPCRATHGHKGEWESLLPALDSSPSTLPGHKTLTAVPTPVKWGADLHGDLPHSSDYSRLQLVIYTCKKPASTPQPSFLMYEGSLETCPKDMMHTPLLKTYTYCTMHHTRDFDLWKVSLGCSEEGISSKV